MRPSLEWLLLPLCLLPLLAVGAFHLWAKSSWDRERAGYREGGEAKARAWLDVAETRERLRAEFLAPPPTQREYVNYPSGTIRFQLDGTRGRFHAGLRGRYRPLFNLGTPDVWQFTMSPPTGLTPTALSRAGTRLAVEVGRTPVELDSGWIDEGTRQFAALLEAPDLDALRTAALPAATKRFLLGRWKRNGFAHRNVEMVAAWLDVMVRFQDWFEETGHTAGVGFHPLDEFAIGVRGERERSYTVSEAKTTHMMGVASPLPVDAFVVVPGPEGYNASVVLHGTAGPVDPGTERSLLWTGWLEGPVAAHWSFVARHGPNWWNVPRLRRFIAPGLMWLLGFLVLEAALWWALRKRRRLDEARSRFINEIAHDLRTPLTSLRLYTDLLAREQTSEADRAKYIDTMQRESARVSALLGNVLDLSRLDGGRRALLAEPLELAPLLASAARDFRLLYPQRADDLDVSVLEGLCVRGDGAGISRCVANLLDNAGKYTALGTRVRLEAKDESAGVVVRVTDEGPGVAEGERRHVFTRYQRGRQGQRDGVPGTGLGLALVKELATAMGGSVRLAASEVGAAFELRLPGVRDA